MSFLHKETTWTIQVLTQVWEKSSYVAWTSVSWHLKPLSLEDSTFDTTWISWATYKFTVKWTTELKQWDHFLVWTDKYSVKDYKKYSWINFNTTKFLLVIE